MGKWAPGHYDDVLIIKLKKIFARALELNEFTRRDDLNRRGESGDSSKRPLFTFEQFTAELDDSDPFVLGLIGVLVKVGVYWPFCLPFHPEDAAVQEVASRRDRQGTGVSPHDPTTGRISEPSEIALRALLDSSSAVDAGSSGGWASRAFNNADSSHPEGNWLQRLEEIHGREVSRYDDVVMSEPSYTPPSNAGAADYWTGHWEDVTPPVAPRSPDPSTGSSVLVGRRRALQRARTAEFASHTSRRRSSQRIGLLDERNRDGEAGDDDPLSGIPTPTLLVRPPGGRERRGYDAVRDAAMRESGSSELGPRSSEGPHWVPPRLPSPSDHDSALTSRALLLRSRTPIAPASQGGPTRTLRRGGLRAPELELVSRFHSPPPRPLAVYRSPSPMYSPLTPSDRPAGASAVPTSVAGEPPTVVVQLGTPRSLSPSEN
ncbi:uncharacterized protein EI90DRAFT_3013114 [Cantharellus anzutake]|uniref:uncharacterized protein n=1 Tax=Cantharellus anzutake TaxID=1750568 RepID=UPI001907B4A6|nr:uncharacterized protein EI90DRAFT_3013114 [Cantharellus anzutake]KAF8339040.1 hypothetical protein EI90DRAFT_3013114 [Cantharellus anzutake]